MQMKEITLVSVHDEMEVDEEVVEVINIAKLIIDAAQVSDAGDKDKGKGIWIEPVKLMKKKDQIGFDEETTLKLQAEFDEKKDLQEKRLKKNKKPILP
ncbi:hypothetical protein Tco_0687914 [Tanacetum coccineum]